MALGSKSFAGAARLFDPGTRRDVMLLYCWCRHCDDVTDGQQLGHGRLTTADDPTLLALREASLAAVEGRPRDEPPFLALAEVVRRHRIERQLIEDHLDGFALDVAGWQPESLEDTLRYSYHVAGSVGIMMATVMNVREPVTLARACDLGIAFQLTNIARDVVEDARAGRCYLPAKWLRPFGLKPAALPDPDCHQRLYPLVVRLLNLAEPYYDSAGMGLAALPPRSAWAIAVALEVYRDIGRAIIHRGPAALSGRSRTGRARKLWRLITGGSRTLVSRRASQENPARSGLWTPASLDFPRQAPVDRRDAF